MKKSKRFLSLLLAVIMVVSLMLSGVSAATVASDPNLIYAEDFEELTELPASGEEGVLFNDGYYGAKAYEFATDAKSGSKSIKLMAEKMTSKPSWTQLEYGIGRLALKLDVAKFEVGATYKVTGWFKISTGCPQIDIDVQAPGQTDKLNVGSPVPAKDVGSDWYKYEVEFEMPEGITASQLIFRFGVSYPVADTIPYALVDDISIVKVGGSSAPEGGGGGGNEGGNEGGEGTTPAVGVNMIVDGSFEQSVDNTVTGQESDKDAGTLVWNGADLSENWATIHDSGKVIFEVVKDATVAQDGDYCVKITPSGTGRGGVQYNIDGTADLVEGAEYILTIWFKGSGNPDYKGRVQAVHLTSGNTTVSPTLTENWQKTEHAFIYSGQRTTVNLNFGMFAAGTTGSVYIDNISLVRVAKAESVTLDAEEVWLEPGQTKTLVPTIIPSDIPLDIVYKTSNAAVATVDADGKITAVGVGETIISATATGGATATCKVKVVDNYVVATGLAIAPATLAVTPGWQQKLDVVFTPADATNQEVVWASSDSTVVTVDQSGNIVALKSGTANITATSGSLSATCAVTVAEDPSYQNKTGSIAVEFGQSSTLDLSTILAGAEYTVITAPKNGMIAIDGSSATYTAYTWLMNQNQAFTDQSYIDFSNSTYTDSLVVAVKDGDKTATITLDVTIGKLADLFYDDAGNWIGDVDLMFSEEHLAYVKTQVLNGDSLYNELFLKFIKNADNKLISTPAQYIKPDYDKVTYSYDTDSRNNADTTVTFLVAYLITKDVPGYEAKNATYFDKTIEWASACLWFPFWGTYGYQNNDLAGGHHLFAMAMVYHWLKDELADMTVDHRMGTDGSSEEAWNNTVKVYEDQPFLEALEMRLWQAGRDMYSRNYDYDVYVMNHLHVRMAGLFGAATALREQADLTAEEKAELVKWTGMALYKVGVAMHSLMPDGTSQEGLPYWEYAAEFLIRSGVNAELSLGIDLFGMTNVFQHSGDYIMYNLLPSSYWRPTNSVLNVGDSPLNHYNGPSWILRWIAAEYGDANAQWLAGKVEDGSIDSVGSPWMSIILADPDLAPVAPTLDKTLHWFKDMDHIIARTDWSGSEDLLSIKCGIPMGKNLFEMIKNGEYGGDPDAGHAHPDANHISLYSNGEFILWDDGYMDKFTGHHNTLLVNGKGQLGEGGDWLQELEYVQNDAQPFIKLAESNSVYDYIVGDATEAYAGNLGLYKYERNVLWLKEEQVLLVVDDVLAADGTELELRWFTNTDVVLKNRNHYYIASKNNNMNFYPFTNANGTSFEKVLMHGENSTYNKDTFRQVYTGGKWQNAVAFSWNDSELVPAEVKYVAGAADEHKFEVGGKIYTINVATNVITVADGQIPETDTGAASDSTLSGISIDGKLFENFNPATTEYNVTRWWDADYAKIAGYAAVPGATVTVESTADLVTITCVSKDGTSTTVYKIKCSGALEAIKLSIVGAESDVTRENYDLASSYDGIVTEGNTGSYWTVQAPESGKINVVYDFGELVRIQSVDIAMQNSKSRTNYYDLLISKDGETWTTVKEMDGIAPTADISANNHAFRTVVENASLVARYAKVVLRGNVTGETDNRDKAGVFSGINEIAFFGWKLADEMEKLTIVDAESDVTRENYDLNSSFDGIVTEGNTGSYWTVQAPESGKINVVYDMGRIVKIMKIDLAMQNSKSRTNYYDLLISEDGETWTTVKEMDGIEPTADISANNHAFRTIIDGEELEARYVKVVLRGNVTGTTDNRDKAGVFSGINEIAIYGQKLEIPAEKLTIVGAESDVTRENYDLNSSFDGIVTEGNTGSYWTVQAPENGKINVIYDLGKVALVRKIDLAMQNSKSRTNYYDLLVSVDGETWTMVQELKSIEPTADISANNHAFRTILEETELVARYVKVVLRGNVTGETDNRDKAGVFSGINEITIYGNKLYEVSVESETEGADFTIVGEKDYYRVGDKITVTANVPEGKKFVRWEVEGIELDDPTNSTIVVKISSYNIKLTAVFEDIVVDDGGDDEEENPVVDVTGGTIADSKDSYEVGDEITVTADVPEGKKFVRWEVEGIDVDDLTAATITFTLGEDDVKLVAIFEDVTVDDGGDDDDDDDDTTTDDDDGASDTGDNAMLMPALLLAVMALAACAVLTIGKKYRR